MLGKQLIQAAAGAAGAGGAGLYVDDVFSTFLYTGDNSVSTQTFNTGLDMSGEGGMIWFKSRSNSQVGRIIDTVRGTNESLIPSGDNSSGGLGSNGLTFLSNGFSLGWTGGDLDAANDYVSWSFRKAPGFFDVVTFVGNQTTRTIAHSLGSVPGMVIIKNVSGSGNWEVFHRSTGNEKTLRLNLTNAQGGTTAWNDTSPTATHFTVSTSTDVNKTGDTFVAYIFAHDEAVFGTDEDESIIKCGSYAGNGSSGQIIDLGFEAQWLMIKSYTRGGNGYGWTMVDIMRDETIFADETGTSGGGFLSSSPSVRASANGFHLLNGDSNFNESGESYIYMAIRRPNKPPSAATEVFAMDYGNGSSTIPTFDSGFPVDFAIHTAYASTDDKNIFARLLGTKALVANSTSSEYTASRAQWDSNVGWATDWPSARISYMFKRAPGFFDVVAYTGTGSARTVNHNLSAIPELVIVKKRNDSGTHWGVYNSFIGNTKGLNLNRDKPAESNSTSDLWNNTSPTLTNFSVNTRDTVNASNEPYIAFLFATRSNISKVGNYTGTGNDVNVDCGFSSGARFVLIKRTDSDAEWFLFDTLRGIVSGNDPYLLLSTTGAQVTNTDYIDPLSSGFTVTSSAPTGLNASGGTYIFLAIA